jgi:MoaA/NifB/PqqE/SkfB family radical SAM enzyme
MSKYQIKNTSKIMDTKTNTKKGKYSKLKIVWHPEKLNSFITGIPTAPIYVRIKPTNRCDHNCFDCVYNSDFSGIHTSMRKADEIPREKMLEILKDFKEIGVKSITYSGGGEPLVHPNIIEILNETEKNNIYFSIITNGQNLMGEAAKILARSSWVRVSANYCDEETFVKTRRINPKLFHEIKENIKNFSKIKNKDCSLQVNCVINEYNHDKVYDMVKFFKELGVENIKLAPQWSPKFEEYHKPFKEKVIEQIEKAKKELEEDGFEIEESYRRYFTSSGKTEREYTKCLFSQVLPVIGADLKVYFCHNKAYDPRGIIGTIKDKSFKEMWFSDETKKRFDEFNPKFECNHECTNDDKNKLYHEMIDCSLPEVVNFP